MMEGAVKTAIAFAFSLCLAAVMAASCSKDGDTSARDRGRSCPYLMEKHHHAGRCHGGCRHHEYRCGSGQVIAPREFFDASDFGRGHDSLYGGPHGPSDDGRVHHGDRRHGSFYGRSHRSCPHRCGYDRDREDKLSERFAPSVEPCPGHDE